MKPTDRSLASALLALGLVLLLLQNLAGCGGGTTSSTAITPTSSGGAQSTATVPQAPVSSAVVSTDLISSLQALSNQVTAKLTGRGASKLLADSCGAPDPGPCVGASPVQLCFSGTGNGGGLATVVGCYADGQPSNLTVTLASFVFPDGTTATGTFSIVANLTVNGGKRSGTTELTGKVDFGKLGQHSFDIFLGYRDDRLIATKAGIDGSTPVNLFALRLENHAQCDDDKVFVTIIGQDAAKPASTYYLARAGNTSMTVFPNEDKSSDGSYPHAAEKSFALTSMYKIADHTYQVNVPTDNLISGKVFFAVGQKLKGIGANGSATKVSLPSATAPIDAGTMFEQIEMSATIGKDDPSYTLFVNATTIDFVSFGPALRVDKVDGTSHVVGFSGASQTTPDGTYCVRDDFVKAMGQMPAAFQNYVLQGGVSVYGKQPADPSTVVRVLGPVQVVPLGTNPTLNTYLDKFIAQNWNTLVAQLTASPFNYQDVFTWSSDAPCNPPAGLDPALTPLCLTCTSAAGANTGKGDLYSLGPPTTKVVFDCDDPDHVEGASPYSYYANSGSDAHKRLASIICAGFNRGVLFDNRSSGPFYSDPGQNYNCFSKIVHDLAYQHIMYGFGYDDVYGQDGTQAGPIGLTRTNTVPPSGNITLVTVIIPSFKPVGTELPTLTFSPTSGSIGDSVTLTAPIPGSFTGAANVLFVKADGTKIGVGSGNFQVDGSGNTITTVVPPGVSGSVAIQVSVSGFPNGLIDCGAARFTVTAPSFTFTPTSAKYGATLTFTLGKFTLPPNPVVIFPSPSGEDGKGAGAPLSESNGTYTAIVPNGNIGSGHLLIPIVGGGNATSTVTFTLIP